MSKQREGLDLTLEALMDEMRQTLSKLDPEEKVWIHKPPGMPPIISIKPVPGAVPYSPARLIAAAPELLNALEDLVLLAQVVMHENGGYMVDDELADARAAIAKAKGEV